MAKFKIKTKKSAAKRFKLKPSGKIKRAKKNKQHILTKKKRSRKNKLKKPAYIHASDRKRVLRCLPNG
jgi:large subunit ribosomal protein L35